MRRSLSTMMLLILAAVAVLALTPSGAAAALETLNIEPLALTIGTFYAGQDAQVSGEIAQGQDILLEFKGPSEDVNFDLKGRVGPFWMNRGLVKVRQAPSLYILLLPAQVPAGADLPALGVGMAHLQAGVDIQSPGLEAGPLFARFLDFQKASGLYQEIAGAVTYESAGPGRRRFTARFRFPSALTAGPYRLTATVLEGGAQKQRLVRDYPVRDGAFLKMVKDMAYDRALLFGVLCVLIALVTGALMGVVFKGGKGGH
ncbi:MAG: TIGR02186 family protein [Pseudomonadota bacterium]